MGMNAYFAFQVVGTNGNGKISYGQALTAVFVEGLIFMALTWLGIRQWLVRVLPSSIKIASGVGIGLFLTVIGLGPAAGIGLISGGGTASPLKIAGCPPQYIDGTSGMCLGHVMTSPTVSFASFVGLTTCI
jgi:AGZA family xanthine/uracil permease-like MFS transporter